jgi:hypothetical protein
MWEDGWCIFLNSDYPYSKEEEAIAVWFEPDTERPNYDYDTVKHHKDFIWNDIASRCTPLYRNTFNRRLNNVIGEIERKTYPKRQI